MIIGNVNILYNQARVESHGVFCRRNTPPVLVSLYTTQTHAWYLNGRQFHDREL